MKKMFAALLVLTLLWGIGAGAMAEETAESLQWSDCQTQLEKNGVTGAFHFLNGTGLMLWIPDSFEVYENQDVQPEETENGQTAVYFAKDLTKYIQVLKVQTEAGADIASLRDELLELGMTPRLVNVNGLEGVRFLDDNLLYLILKCAEDMFLQFVFCPVAEVDSDADFHMIAASVQPENADVITEYWHDFLMTVE